MRTLLIITAASEVAVGIAMLAAPALIVATLLGVPLDTPGGLAIGRLAGAALLALGVACLCASRDVRSRAAAGVVAAMLLYNVAVAVLLVSLRCCASMTGMGLWPAVVLHSALAVWCMTCLRGRAALAEASTR